MATTRTDFSTPDIPMSEATFYVSACTRINAPASLVFRTLRNTETWRDWNRWIPRVTITFQPEEEDDATLAEIEELVRNTSIAVSFDSDITDGAVGPPSPAPRRSSRLPSGIGAETGSPPSSRGDTGRTSSEGFSPLPVTRQRLASNAGRASEESNGERPRSNATNGLSGAQKYQAAQETRKSSIASGKEPATANSAVMLESPAQSSILMPAPANTASTALAVSHKASRRKSGISSSLRRQLHINALYGEPSVRIQLATRMTLHMRMKLPHSHELREQNVIVTEVSRPDDPLDEPDPGGLARAPTHTVSKSGVYRIVWTLANSYNPPKSYPKFLLQTQRVHEIRPIVSGDGTETCEYWDWEAQKGMLAKRNKKEQAQYMKERMAEWGTRLGAFCESMGGAVERRDFVNP
ncbi:hypothetical protein A1O3_05870 [Capronia epimyces CBS 606.96]|uniref:Uncharacterized protein n=1 Tax=Capronia epimyces CBS 606.96 TaxID=1182542 RepID=W9Y6D2_9EURO|nr:uncharacterized protein A1O3_05870 [Capronia epimyces CBS 606.96]EXJ85195.1 hypothetical protein A1O3_05870 [Capronia epimyces CBS 606.96]